MNLRKEAIPTKNINILLEIIRDIVGSDPILAMGKDVIIPSDVKIIGIDQNKVKFIELGNRNIEYFDGMKWVKVEDNVPFELKKHKNFIIREVVNGKYSKAKLLFLYENKNRPDWIKVNGNKVSDLSGNMEYRNITDKNWKDVTDTEMVLDKGTYEFRFKGGFYLMGSESNQITISS